MEGQSFKQTLVSGLLHISDICNNIISINSGTTLPPGYNLTQGPSWSRALKSKGAHVSSFTVE